MNSSFCCFLIFTLSQSAENRFEVRTVDSHPKAVDLRVLKGGKIETVAEGSMESDKWYSLRRGTVLPDLPSDPHVELANGDRIVGTVVASDGDTLTIRLPIAGKEQTIKVPLSAVRVAWLTRQSAEPPRWLDKPRARDVFQTRNGDLHFGSLTEIDSGRGSLRFQADGKDQGLDLSKVAAIGFNTDLARDRRPKGRYYRATLLDGSRLSIASIEFDGKTWTFETLFRQTVIVPSTQLASLIVEQGAAVFASQVVPLKYSYDTFDGEDRSWTADKTAAGEPLRLNTAPGESTFDRGVGLRSGSSITYAVAGKYKSFESLVGLDSRLGVKGDVELAIELDGRVWPIPEGKRLNAARGPIELRIDLVGVKQLTIHVRRGEGGNVQDHVNFADARFVLGQ
jgi:hypothetical protein